MWCCVAPDMAGRLRLLEEAPERVQRPSCGASPEAPLEGRQLIGGPNEAATARSGLARNMARKLARATVIIIIITSWCWSQFIWLSPAHFAAGRPARTWSLGSHPGAVSSAAHLVRFGADPRPTTGRRAGGRRLRATGRSGTGLQVEIIISRPFHLS